MESFNDKITEEDYLKLTNNIFEVEMKIAVAENEKKSTKALEKEKSKLYKKFESIMGYSYLEEYN